MLVVAKLSSACALLAIAIASPALAASRGLAPAFGNTVVSTHPDGRTARLWLRADHTFTAQGRGGNRSSGVWRTKGDSLCLTQRRPVPIPVSYCHRFPAVAVGERWNDTASNGDAVVNQIVPGR
ncbi:MAG: hypothetical protein V4466_00670 [Pseudomonadota bacterium]